MILAVDVQYDDGAGTGRVGAIWFADWADAEPLRTASFEREDIAPYEPGHFYKRELPCVLDALAHEPRTALIVVDGYVDLGSERPGLGRHVHAACGLPVVGVAKSRFHAAPGIEVCRGGSARPLFVTAVGVDVARAAAYVAAMHGPFRVPTHIPRYTAAGAAALGMRGDEV